MLIFSINYDTFTICYLFLRLSTLLIKYIGSAAPLIKVFTVIIIAGKVSFCFLVVLIEYLRP